MAKTKTRTKAKGPRDSRVPRGAPRQLLGAYRVAMWNGIGGEYHIDVLDQEERVLHGFTEEGELEAIALSHAAAERYTSVERMVRVVLTWGISREGFCQPIIKETRPICDCLPCVERILAPRVLN